jgi:hypothetical protein
LTTNIGGFSTIGELAAGELTTQPLHCLPKRQISNHACRIEQIST